MTGLDAVLVAVFAAVWLVPLGLAVRWERRLRTERHGLGPVPEAAPGTAAARVRGEAGRADDRRAEDQRTEAARR